MSDVKSDGKNQWTDRLPTVDQVRRLAAAGEIPPVWIAVTLVAFFPLGLYLVWMHPGWPAKAKGLWTGAWAVAFVVGMLLLPRLTIATTVLGMFAVGVLVIVSHRNGTNQQRRAFMAGWAVFCLVGLLLTAFLGGKQSDVSQQDRSVAANSRLTGQSSGSGKRDRSNDPDYDLTRLKFPATVDVSQGPNGEDIKVEEDKFTVGYPTSEKWHYYLSDKNEKVKHGIFRAYVDAVVITEKVYLEGRPRLENTWTSKGVENTRQEYLDAQWNRQTEYGVGHKYDIVRALVRFQEVKVTKYEGGGSSTEEVWERILDGETTKYYPDGKLKETIVYDKGKINSHTLLDIRGRVIFQK